MMSMMSDYDRQAIIDGFGSARDFWHETTGVMRIKEVKPKVKPEVKVIKPKAPPKPEIIIKDLFVSEEQRKALWMKAPWIAKVYSHGIHWGDLTIEQQKAVKTWTVAKKKGLPPEVPEPTKINKLYAEGVKRGRERPTPPKFGLSIEAIHSEARKTIQPPKFEEGIKHHLTDFIEQLKNIIKPLQFYPDLPMTLRNAIRVEMIGGINKLYEKVYNQIGTALWEGLKETEKAQSVELIFARDQLSRAKLGKGDPRISVEEAQKLVDKLEKEIFPEAKEAANRYRTIQEEYRRGLVERGLLDEDQKIDDYVRHFVTDYTPDWTLKRGVPARLKRPFRGYLKPAFGTTKVYKQDAEAIMAQFLQIEHDNLIEDFIKKQATIYDLVSTLTKEQRIKLFGVDKAGRVRSPKPGRIYTIEGKRYRAYTPDIPFSRQLFPTEEGLMALGRNKKTYLVPENIWNTFRDFRERGSVALYYANQVIGWWKTMAITSRFVSFNINNMIGDAHLMMLQAPEPLKFLRELDTMVNYIGRNPADYNDYLKSLDKWMKEQSVLDAYFIKELPYIAKSRDPVKIILKKARETSGFRENLLRIAHASYLWKQYLAGRGKEIIKMYDWIGTEGLSEEAALGKIARDVGGDYMWTSKTFNRIMRGLITPFGTWYLKMSAISAKMHFSRHLPKIFAFFIAGPLLALLYNKRKKEINELEQLLSDGARNRIHFVIRENPDGTIRIWMPQLPQDVLIGTKIYSIAVNQANQVINKEKTIKEAAIDTIKEWGIKEAKGIIFLLSPVVRYITGLIDRRDPFDKMPIYPIPKEKLPEASIWYYNAIFFAKTFIPYLSMYLGEEALGKPADLVKKDIIDKLVSWGALGVYDITPKAEIIFEGQKIDWDEFSKLQNASNRITLLIDKNEDDWVASGLMPEEFVETKEFENNMLKIREMLIKINPEAEKATPIEIAIALDTRLANKMGESIDSAQKWLRIQLERAKTDEEKKKWREKFEEIRKMNLIDSLKRLPKLERELYFETLK